MEKCIVAVAVAVLDAGARDFAIFFNLSYQNQNEHTVIDGRMRWQRQNNSSEDSMFRVLVYYFYIYDLATNLHLTRAYVSVTQTSTRECLQIWIKNIIDSHP